MANEVTIHISAKDTASKTFKDVEKSAGGLGKVLGDVGKVAAGFLAANVVQSGVKAFTGFIGKSITEGIKLGESLNAVNKIFGESSKTVLDWGKQNATSFGLSQQSFNQLATPMGAILKNAGFTMDETAEKTITLTKRAADMASVFNTDVKTALEAIMSGLKGEANPLEQFGVGVTAAKVELRAMAETGKASASMLTDLEKTTARVNLILAETATSQGDFADTSKEAANAARIQQAKMEELQATIGTKLIPVQLLLTKAKLAMVDAIATKVLPAVEGLAGFLRGRLLGSFEVVKEVVSELKRLFDLGFGGGAIGGEFSTIEKAAFGLGEVFRNDILPAFNEVKQAFSLFMLALKGGDAGGELGKLGKAAFDAGQFLKPVVDTLMGLQKEVIIGVAVAIGGVLVLAFSALAIAAGAAAIGVIASTAPIIAIAAAVVIAVVALQLLVKHWDEIKAKAIEVFGSLPGPIQEAMQFIHNNIKARIEGVKQIFESLVEIVSSVVNLVSALFHGDWARAWGEMKDIAGATVDLLIGYLKMQFGNIPGIVLGLVSDAARAGLALGKALANGVIDGINSLLNSLSGKVLIPGVNLGILGSTPEVRLPGLGSIPRLAAGMPFVPFDNFPALLHKGERVMTAAENRQGGGGMTVVYVPVTGAPEFDRAVERAVVDAARRGGFRGVPGLGAA